jgi:hypothetical protein
MVPNRSGHRGQVKLLKRSRFPLQACYHKALVIGEVHGDLERVIALRAHLTADNGVENTRDRTTSTAATTCRAPWRRATSLGQGLLSVWLTPAL